MTKASWSYGELFQGVGNCHPGYGKTTFDIRLVDIGETFSKGQFDRPFLINAASLDAVFQSWLGATYNNGAFEVDKPFVPTSIGELEISVDVPADADSVMPGLRRAERYGFNELSADIVCFDTEISKVFLFIKDFRTSEPDMEAGKPDGESVEVDPADITSEVQWNHALSVLQPEEISQVVSVVPTQERLTEVNSESFISLPSPPPPPPLTPPEKIDIKTEQECSLFAWCSTISGGDRRRVDLNPGELSNAAMSKLPTSVILLGQIRYAIANNTREGGKNDADTSGHFISLVGENDTPLLADNNKASADMLVITQQVEDAGSFVRLIGLARLQLAKPHATVVVAASNDAAASRLVTADKGFQVVSRIADGKSLALYSNNELRMETVTNGVSKHEVVGLKPSTADSATQDFSSMSEKTLQSQGYSVTTEPWGAGINPNDPKGKTYVSLLELEQPLLDNLSKRDFHKVRAVVLNCERLLWITHGDNPSFGMIDGFARCIMSEIAGTTFQLLHPSEATGLQHGASLATRMLESDSNDNKDREVGGILQVARIFKSECAY